MIIQNLQAICLLAGAIFSILCAAFFTASEIALISSDKIQLKRLKERGFREAIAALKLQENIDWLLTTTQLGANVSVALATTLATIFIRRAFDIRYEFALSISCIPLLLIFSDSLSKVIARHRADRIALQVALPLLWFQNLIRPIVNGVSRYVSALTKNFPDKQDTLSRRKRMREEVQSLLSEGEEDNTLAHGHKRLIKRILDFSKHNVRKALLPLVNVDAISKETTMAEAIDKFEELRHSRLPFFDERVNNIVGVLDVKDLFFCEDLTAPVSKYMHPPLFVPEYQQLAALTSDLRNAQASITVVVDEYGGAVGILTKEDVVEEIVGDIADEFDENSLSFREISPHNYLVSTAIDIDSLNERLETKIPKGDYETLSGFLLQQFNRIPMIGDELHYANLRFRVHRATEKVIQTVIITALEGSELP